MSRFMLTPGETIPAEVLADSNGDVADVGQGVAVVGETENGVQVELVEAVSDRCIGLLDSTPQDLEDPDTAESDITAGNSAGMASVVLTEYVVWVEEDSGYTASVGDYVQMGDGGDVESYTGPTTSGVTTLTNTLGIDANGNLENDTAGDIDIDFTSDAFPWGYVLTTIPREWGVSGKVAVVRLGV